MRNVLLARYVYEALGRGDVEAVLSALAPDIEWREAEGNPAQLDGAPWFGPDAVDEKLFRRLAEGWDGFTCTPTRIHDAGDVVVVEGRYSGVVRSTGTSVDAQFCHLWTVRRNQMASFQQYVDTAQLQRAMFPGRMPGAAPVVPEVVPEEVRVS